jgi:hypothetical protein
VRNIVRKEGRNIVRKEGISMKEGREEGREVGR